LAAHAASSATVSTTWTRSPDVLKVVAMTAKTSGDSSRGVSGFIFRRIQDSFTTQGLRANPPESDGFSSFLTRFPCKSPPSTCRAGVRPRTRQTLTSA
jgi:hypothetical protein